MIPDIPTLRGFAVEVDSEFFEQAVERYHREKKAGTPIVEFKWADVSSEALAPPGSCKAVIWNGDVPYYLKKYAMDLQSGVRLREQLNDREKAKEQVVDNALVNSYNLLESGGVLIATGENPIEVYDRAKRLNLPVAKLTLVGEAKPPGPPKAMAVVLHKP